MNLLLFYGNALPTSSSSSSSSGSSNSSNSSGSSSSSDSSSSGNSSGSSQDQSKRSFEAEGGIENIGLAVFKGAKMVGKLNATETLSNLMVRNKLKSCTISVRDPENENNTIDLFLTLNDNPKIEATIINGSPYISTKMNVNARVSSVDQTSQEMSKQRIQEIEEAASHYLKSQLTNYFYKTAKEFHADISATGKYALKNFKTTSEFNEYQWLENYQDAFFDVDVNVTIKSSFLLT